MNGEKIERIPHGPTYGGGHSNAGIVLVGFNLLATAITSETSPICFLFGAMLVLSFILFMNYRGVQIDYRRNKIRIYHSFLGLRYGRWHDLKKFESVVLYFLSSVDKVSGGRIGDANFRSKSYTIELIGKTKENKIELNEIPGYEEALEFAKKYATKLNKSFVNVIEVALKNRNKDYY